MNSWGRTYVDKYISKYEVNRTVGYRVFINRHDLKVNERFETLEKAKDFRDRVLKICEQKRIEKVAKELNIHSYPDNIILSVGFNVEDCIEHFEERLHQINLTERELEIVALRFEEFKNLEEIGNKYGLSRERIRQIIVKILSKIKHRSSFFTLGKYTNKEKLAQEEYEKFLEEKKKEWSYESAKAFIEMYEASHKKGTRINPKKISLEDLELSARPYNCLRKHAKCITLADVIELSYDDLMKVRNMGKRSAQEIVAKVREYGYIIE